MITPVPNQPALLLRDRKDTTLAVADLHIGWEMALAEKGIHVPSQTFKLLLKLKNLASCYKPEKLLILGDIKHTIAKAVTSEWHDVPEFFNELKNLVNEICIVRGNHDGNLEPLLPENVKIMSPTGITLRGVGFFHGHQWPSPKLLKCRTLVMGHVHPVVGFRDPSGFRITRQVWIRAKCDAIGLSKVLLQKNNIKIERSVEETLRRQCGIKARVSELFIMPPFNDFLGGKPLNQQKFGHSKSEMVVGPVLRSEAVDIENAEAYLLDGTFLGTLDQLRVLS